MKLYNRTPAAAEASPAQDIRKLSNTSAGRSAGADAPWDPWDRVDFSSSLGRLARTLSTYETSRSSRVQARAAEYQSGHYRADSAATSRDMVSGALVGQ